MAEKKLTSYPKEKINILFLENISDVAVKHFNVSGYANVKKINGALSEIELIAAIKDVHLLGIRSKTLITKKVLEAATKLQAIGCFCIGVNQVDLKSQKTKFQLFGFLGFTLRYRVRPSYRGSKNRLPNSGD